MGLSDLIVNSQNRRAVIVPQLNTRVERSLTHVGSHRTDTRGAPSDDNDGSTARGPHRIRWVSTTHI
jgi:hypothetical protein